MAYDFFNHTDSDIAAVDNGTDDNYNPNEGQDLVSYYNNIGVYDREDYTIVNETKSDSCSDITSSHVPETLEEIEQQIDRLKLRWSEVTYLIGQRLKYISDNRLYEEKGYHDFKTYVTLAIKMSENNAYYYISVFEYFTEEQTKTAGSKLKLIIPVLNKLKRDKDIPENMREMKMKTMRDELYYKICNKTYREAERIIFDIRQKSFMDMTHLLNFQRIKVLKDKIIINEPNEELQKQIVALLEEFYN